MVPQRKFITSAAAAAAALGLLLSANPPAHAAPATSAIPTSSDTLEASPKDSPKPRHPESWYDEAVNAKSCPSKAPENTLRDGAKKLGLKKLCARSISEAATPNAAYAIKYALRNLGKKYVQPEREVQQRDNLNRYDCSSYVSRSYQAGSIDTAIKDGKKKRYPVTVEIRDSVDWTQKIERSDARPGDLVVYYTGAGGYGHHVVMLLGGGLMAHVNDYGEITHVSAYDHDAVSNPVYLRAVEK